MVSRIRPTPARRLNTEFLNRRITIIALLGFASGLPLSLSDSTLQAWLTVEGVDIMKIGALFSSRSAVHLQIPVGAIPRPLSTGLARPPA